MTTKFPYVAIDTAEKRKVFGVPLDGTRIYYRRGNLKEYALWMNTLFKAFGGQGYLGPGLVPQLVSVSRSAVYKRIAEGRLTVFCFELLTPLSKIAGHGHATELSTFHLQNGLVTYTELMAWAEEIKRKKGKISPILEGQIGDKNAKKEATQ